MLFPNLGNGIGLRTVHYPAIMQALSRPTQGGALSRIDWFEIISENFIGRGGNPRRVLSRVRQDFDIGMHGVAMSLGSSDELDFGYLDRLAALADEFEPAIISDHLSWSGVGGHFLHDLLPLPYTEEALEHVSERIAQVQERLGRRILVENISSYAAFCASAIPESDFLSAVAERADCGILLDVNNVSVSAHNHGFDPAAFIRSLPSNRIGQIHLAGHRRHGELRLDTHDCPVSREVWMLYRLAIATHGHRSTLVEWDDNVPSFERVAAECELARKAAESATEATHA